MMKKFLSSAVVFLSLFLMSISSSFAKDVKMVTIYITAESEETPSGGSGLLFFSDHIEEVNNCDIQEIDTNKYLISYKISKKQFNKSKFFNAILLSESGKQSFGIMRSPEVALNEGILEPCPIKDPSQALKTNQDYAVYERIIKLKSDRVESEKKAFLNTLDLKTEKKIRILGEKLGAFNSTNFSELKEDPLELVYELSKLEEAIKTYLASSPSKQKKSVK